MKKTKSEEMARNLGQVVLNSFSEPTNRKEFIAEMGKEHRTLQQRFTQLCFDWLEHCDTMSTDGRNEASKEIANKLFDFMEKEELCYNRKFMVPFI